MTTETLLFNGVDLRSVCLPEDLNEFWSSAELRGDLPVYAGVPGAVPTRRPPAAKVRNGTVSVTGDTFPEVRDAVAAVRALLREGRPQTVTRRSVTTTGDLDAAQTVIVRSVAERWPGGLSCTLVIDVETLDGPWYGASVAIPAVGAVSIEGDSPTRAIVAALSAGAVNPIVTNTTNGYTFRYVGTVPAGGVEVDVLQRTATRVSDSGDVSSALKWSKADPFQLDPGAQTLTVSSGTASFTYLPAYA